MSPARAALALLAAGLVAAAATLGGAQDASPASGVEPAGERAWSVQLHLHGPASEGAGSVDSHSREAARVGVDVLWWSEHDWRAASYRHVSRYGFEGIEPLDRGEPWTARWPSEIAEQGERAARNDKRFDSTRWTSIDGELLVEGQGSLKVENRTPGAKESGPFPDQRWRVYRRELRAGRGRLKRPLASGVTLRLAVLPAELTPEVQPQLRVELSEHAPLEPDEDREPGPDGAAEETPGTGPEDFAQWELCYYLVDQERLSELAPALVDRQLWIPVGARAGEWNRLELPLSYDALAGFGELGLDNSMARLRVGLAVERDLERVTTVHFDDLRIEQEVSGQAAIERQAALVEQVARRHPGLRELSGLEISYLEPHLNVYGVEPRLPDYDALLDGLPDPAQGPAADAATEARLGARLAARVVDEVHARGGLVSYNHMYGTDMEREAGEAALLASSPREDVLADMLGHRLYGADLLEVGYRDRGGHDLADHLWIWDQLPAAGLFPVGTGVSDSHGGPEQRWSGGGNNFVSWILAPTPSAEDLVAGLAAGRVVFGDIERFDGWLDLSTERGFRMGQVVVTDRAEVRARARIERTSERGGALEGHWVSDALDGGEAPDGGADRRDGGIVLALAGREHSLLRFELRSARGEPLALSNPIHLVRAVPAGGLPAARAGVDLDGVRARELTGLTLRAAAVDAQGLALELDAGGAGSAVLELDDPGRGAHARLEPPLAGTLERDGARIVLRGLSGRGRVLIPSRP